MKKTWQVQRHNTLKDSLYVCTHACMYGGMLCSVWLLSRGSVSLIASIWGDLWSQNWCTIKFFEPACHTFSNYFKFNEYKFVEPWWKRPAGSLHEIFIQFVDEQHLANQSICQKCTKHTNKYLKIPSFVKVPRLTQPLDTAASNPSRITRTWQR